ncbi:phage baseplate assembly protein V [Natronospirillum operosum]|uniref:Phage baseplate assembly protein V n=1 Tax=Natronospirillum operosum TaxID=2759953 RepID=A0A4Z0W932_9GAMM|nr:phage baseplate assembly protein V [Natronospirillum operosum]TGG92548.1 phage baseplate assembly protein V [Natronospirillum operosum]
MRESEVRRLITNLIRLGTIAEVDGARARVQTGANLTPWCAWLTQRAGDDSTWWAPSVGEQVILLSPGGDLAQAVILPALYQDEFPAPESDPAVRRTQYRDGTYIEHNTDTRQMTIAPAGDLAIHVAGHCTLSTTGDVDVLAEGNGTLAAAGNVEVEAGAILNLKGTIVNLN